MLARDTGLTGIIGQHLAIPPLCHPKLFKNLGDKYELLSYIQNNDYPMLTSGEMESAWDYYTGMGEPEADPLHSPLVSTDLSNLPPARKNPCIKSCLHETLMRSSAAHSRP